MKHVKLFEEYISESTTDGTIESLIEVTKLSMTMGIFDDQLLKDTRGNFISGIEGSLKSEVRKIPSDKKKEFTGYMKALIGPLEKVETMAQLLSAMYSISAAKSNILDRMSVEEALNESKILDWLKKAKTATAEWWQRNKSTILYTILEVLARIIIEILFAVLRAITKSDVKAPKIKFGGGSFGGGGASGKW
jgi:hypothetical protein